MKIMKRTVIAPLAALVICCAQTFAYASFSDVGGHWAEQRILRLVDLGVLSEGENGLFNPDAMVSRADFCVMINRAFGLTGEVNINFDDLPTDNFYYPHIQTAIASGYLSGYDDNTVRPGGSLTRSEAAVILCKILKLPAATGAADKFADAESIPQWANSYVESVVAGGMMSGYPDETFAPLRSFTRAEAVAVISLAIDYTPGTQPPTVPPDSNPSDKHPSGNGMTISSNYGPETGEEIIDGDVTITTNGITLKNIIIKGDLIIDPSSGTGKINLINVTVEGSTYVEDSDVIVSLEGLLPYTGDDS